MSPEFANLFRADQDTDQVWELYSVAIAGGSVDKLNRALPFNGDIDRFSISPDSTHVVYQGDQDVFDEIELRTLWCANSNEAKRQWLVFMKYAG